MSVEKRTSWAIVVNNIAVNILRVIWLLAVGWVAYHLIVDLGWSMWWLLVLLAWEVVA